MGQRPNTGMRVKIASDEAWSVGGKIKIEETVQAMAPMGNMVVKVHQMKRKPGSGDVNA